MRGLVLMLTVSLVIVGCDEEPEDDDTQSDESEEDEAAGDEDEDAGEETALADEAEPDEENLQLDLADMGEEPGGEEEVDSRHIAHILIRYRGAERAPPNITRSADEARALAEQVLERVGAEEFADVARELGEDATQEHGGDLGTITRGLLPDALEEAAFSLDVAEISEVVETPLGFHVVKRIE